MALAIASPFILLYLVYRGVRNPRYFATLGERLGWFPHSFQQTAAGAIWLHAVSVGEIIACAGLLRKLRAEHPSAPLFVSASTLAGRALADQKLGPLVDGIFYAPLDYCFAVRAALRCIRPALVIIAETEIWPNLWRETRRSGAALLVVNARISDAAMPRYRRLGWFFSAVLKLPNAILAQTAVARDRLLELGAPPGRLQLAGNLKYDFSPPQPPAAVVQLLLQAKPAHIWIAASTMPPAGDGDWDEDDVVLDAFQRLAARFPRLLLMLAPRKPERFAGAASKLAARGVPFLRRSEMDGRQPLDLPGVLLVDTIGELAGLFSMAEVVFMGGTLARRGGHNLLEPAWFGKPVVAGPHLENFPEIAGDFRAQNALLEIHSPQELEAAVARLLENEQARRELGDRCLALSRARTGATERAVEQALRLIAGALPRQVRSPLGKLLAAPLSLAWIAGAAWKRRRQSAGARKLPVPVVSIGGISMGGSGKTPLALHLAAKLKAAGMQPGFLTRGYRRRSPTSSTVLAAGAEAAVELTGDEAQILLRSGLGPLGIGADRYRVGERLLAEQPAGILLLDDAFQHWRIARDVDLVLIDALDPFAGGAVFPAGRLREPLSALARADLFLITRTEPGRRYDAIEATLRRYNATAPIFHSRLVPRQWVEAGTGAAVDAASLSGKRVAAFCGLGNPAAFWKTVDAIGCKTAWRIDFPDHHHYRPRDLRRLAARARADHVEALVTTQKDFVNSPPETAAIVNAPPLYWLDVDVEIDREDELLAFLRKRRHAGQS